jgi:Reverse transcriptase (RNA-dependent DNA polymerase)
LGWNIHKKVCKLVKVWFEAGALPVACKIDGFLVGVLGFSRNVSDECFYVRIQGGMIAIIALYVAALLIACNNIGILNEIMEGLSREFEMKDMVRQECVLDIVYFGIDRSEN